MDQIEIHWLWWLVAAIGLGVLEVLTLDLVLLMFAGGAAAALVASMFGAGVTAQVLVFAGVSLAMLLFLRPYLLRNMRRRTPVVETNTAAHVGRTAVTLAEITDRRGLIKLAGEEWSARTSGPGQVIPADVDVLVTAIDGATAVVDLIHQPDPGATDAGSPQSDPQEGDA